MCHRPQADLILPCWFEDVRRLVKLGAAWLSAPRNGLFALDQRALKHLKTTERHARYANKISNKMESIERLGVTHGEER